MYFKYVRLPLNSCMEYCISQQQARKALEHVTNFAWRNVKGDKTSQGIYHSCSHLGVKEGHCKCSSVNRLDRFFLLIFLFSVTAFKLPLDDICNLEIKW